MDGDSFWPVVGAASGIATALATGLAVLLSLWWRRVDAQRPEWTFHEATSRWVIDDPYGNNEPPHASVRLSNSGPGTGFRVMVQGIGCRAIAQPNEQNRGFGLPQFDVYPALPPGDTLKVTVWARPSEWEMVQIAVLWREPSLWRRRRVPRMEVTDLADIAGRPATTRRGTHSETGMPFTANPPEPADPERPAPSGPQWPLPQPGWRAARTLRRRLLRQGKRPRQESRRTPSRQETDQAETSERAADSSMQ